MPHRATLFQTKPKLVLRVLNDLLLIYFDFILFYIENTQTNRNRHVYTRHVHKCVYT